ncbi:hypothetical protein [Lihuaxuella thermophila]|uniref:Uncharacterized protein n=1 Tax=Lihuaxuella thermophila TaxID=1173111 RepID=A0A1H8B4J0_9BACL|nr:hypothetical protein [Lihuaxuella thermophila]SEM77880.1 hypothetical protein SAMN05444955_1023 [Lihuaxuella thermophila]
MKYLTLIKEIQSDKLRDDELIDCLDIPHNFVLSNAIKKIVKKKLCNQDIVSKLEKISSLTAKENKLMGIYTVGHLAIAALYFLDHPISRDKYKELYINLSEWDKEIIEKLTTGDPFLD